MARALLLRDSSTAAWFYTCMSPATNLFLSWLDAISARDRRPSPTCHSGREVDWPHAACRPVCQFIRHWPLRTSTMTAPFSGGCACGAIRYVCARAPVAMLNCHCRDCQLSSGAPFASGVIVLVSDTEITGTPKTYSVRAGSGRLATRSFCCDCGAPLFARSETAPGVMSIRFPTLDNHSEFEPMLDIWTSSAQPWVCLSQAIPHYPQSP